MKNYKTIIAAVAAGLACVATTSHAAVTIEASLLNQTLGAVSGSDPLGTPEGSVSSWVLSGFDTAPGAGLTFVYQIQNGGPDTITEASFSNFAGTTVLSTSTQATFALLNSITGVGGFAFGSETPGGAVTFNGGLASGATSYSDFLIINTTATQWNIGQGREEDDFQAVGNVLAPVPEPTTIAAGILMLLPLGIGAVRSLRKERVS